jgi:hypothetical protein
MWLTSAQKESELTPNFASYSITSTPAKGPFSNLFVAACYHLAFVRTEEAADYTENIKGSTA